MTKFALAAVVAAAFATAAAAQQQNTTFGGTMSATTGLGVAAGGMALGVIAIENGSSSTTTN
ncbi:MAG: hypothetical protein KDA50_14590 [Rhodobacteraceae bacterium]|nr:hypothetical protein [Paracoccaceae bacterium]